MEELLKLESDDTSASRDVANKIHSRLKGARDPSLLGELVEFYFQTYSKRARKILTTLRETHSQVRSLAICGFVCSCLSELAVILWTQNNTYYGVTCSPGARARARAKARM